MVSAYVVVMLVSVTAQDVSQSALSPSNLSFSLQSGIGQQGADVATLLRARLQAAVGSTRVTMAAPVWLAADGEFLTDFEEPNYYLGLLEGLSMQSEEGEVSLVAGALSQQTLGHGVLVDSYQSKHDPLRYRTGARFDLRSRAVDITVLADDLLRPHVVAGAVGIAPLTLAGMDPDRRLRIALEAAADIYAPRFDTEASLGALDLDIAFAIWRSADLMVELFVAGAYISKPAWGAHSGILLQWMGETQSALRFRLEATASADGYVPGYFDDAYSFERFALPERNWMPKAEQNPRGAVGVRARFDAQAGWARFGFAASLADPRRPGSLSLYTRLQRSTWSAAVILSHRSLSEGADLLDIAGPATTASIEGAYCFAGGFFAFTQLRHGMRRSQGALGHVNDWMIGVGYGAQSEPTQ
ncbi:MAG: hypothetical protein A2341_23155 [Deltaproteobacteria bacterium RIFOXYB12_FULL_58_9]|nr:MAG: hypothetical protein A2341_23155 [Deltaproteobacteria bacterium RIFOXYB12_FULL_58_9]